jgi:transposase, IS5 family
MSIDHTGLAAKVEALPLEIAVPSDSPLLQLANLIDWPALADIVLPDLQKTAKGCWWRGRSLNLRIHLGALILQSLFDETDRGTEERLQGDALWQLFAGRGGVGTWRVPDHTRIEDFRSRLSPTTHQRLSVAVVGFARAAGFAKASWMDVDSSVQEANIAFPADASLMVKLARKAEKLVDSGLAEFAGLQVTAKKAASLAKEFFFASKAKVPEYKAELLRVLHKETVAQVVPVIEAGARMTQDVWDSLGSRKRALVDQVCQTGAHLLASIESFIKTGVFDRSKPMSLHAKAVACINKGKAARAYAFGRMFQFGRVEGNFMLVAKAKDLHENDRTAIGRMIDLHRKVFPPGSLESLGADRGYHSGANARASKHMGVKTIAIQKPSGFRALTPDLSAEERVHHCNRRAGIEPLIGHLKHGGLRRSRMKKDETTESSAYRCVTGFNCRQLMGHILKRKAV